MYNFDKMANNEDNDISIIHHHINDVAEDSADEADILARHITLNSYAPSLEHSQSNHVFRLTYDKLKESYNNLYSKSEQKDKRIKELENQLNSLSSSDYSTDSFLVVGDPQPKKSDLDIGILQGRIKELERKLRLADVEIKSLQAEKFQLENTLKLLKNNDQQRDSLERTKNVFLEEKVKKLTERLEVFSMFDKTRDFDQQLIELKTELKQTKDENLSLVVDLRKLSDENLLLKRTIYAKNQNPINLSNGTTGVTSSLSGTGASRDQLNDMSLNSSLPAVDELENLKHTIKKLKTVVENQNAYLIRLDSNPAVKKILRDEKLNLSLSLSGASSRKGSNSSVNEVGTSSSTEVTDSGNMKRHSRLLSSVHNDKVIPNESPFKNGYDLKVELPELEQYDNLESTLHGHLRQYQSKSQSEVISRASDAARDAQRRQSQTLRSTNSAPIFVRESARISPLATSRQSFCAYDRQNNGTGLRPSVDPIVVGASGNPGSQRECERIPSLKECPVCNADFTHKSVTEFQTHVFNCVDSEEQPTTLTCESVPERICPMCNHYFPESCPQLEVDNHVNAHFGEAPTDPFEILSP